MENILIDTDVILDVFFDREPFSDNAAHILGLCEQQRIQGYITPVILSNIYYLLRKTAKHEKVIEKLKILVGIIDIVNIDKSAVVDALNSDFKDFEDALQNFSAQKTEKIHVIITRNIKDYKTSQLSIMTPDDYIKTNN